MALDLVSYDEGRRREGFRLLCGVDEVGRGPLAGPVVAAAVVLDPDNVPDGVDDSKKLSPAKRLALESEIRERAISFGVAVVSPEEIDRINILQASLLAMKRAVAEMGQPPDFILVDGNKPIQVSIPQETVVSGDATSASIAAASILAKEYRDRMMIEYANQFPGYGFENNMGYPTKAHREAIKSLGPTPIHRKTFKGVREYLPPGEVMGQMRLI
ncbi:MAG: ribonuclease HII [Deltaproteobacteria bacterium]|nr:MAG: ribonuclease HII [Deltaproteobacteria bacterium]